MKGTRMLLYLDQHFLSFLHTFLHIPHNPAPQVAERSEYDSYEEYDSCRNTLRNLWLQYLSNLKFPCAVLTFLGKKNILFTFPVIFEILLERSAGRLVLQCNRAWYSLKRGIHQALFHFEREKVNRKYAVLRISEGNAT